MKPFKCQRRKKQKANRPFNKGFMGLKKFPYISYGALSFVVQVLTNYMQLLLYISYDKNNSY